MRGRFAPRGLRPRGRASRARGRPGRRGCRRPCREARLLPRRPLAVRQRATGGRSRAARGRSAGHAQDAILAMLSAAPRPARWGGSYRPRSGSGIVRAAPAKQARRRDTEGAPSWNGTTVRSRRTFRTRVRTFIQENLPQFYRARGDDPRPAGLEGDWQEDIVHGSDEAKEAATEWASALFDRGWSAPHWPKEYGGGGMSTMEQFIFNQEMAELEAPKVGGSGLSLLGPTVLVHGTDAQKEQLLAPTLSGEILWAQGFSEPRRGLGPRLAADARGARRRRLRHQRPEDVDIDGAQVELDLRHVSAPTPRRRSIAASRSSSWT